MKKKTERAITRVVIATGISSVITQMLIIREFLAQFQGNEFIIVILRPLKREKNNADRY